jgi:hypothetical protein
MTEEAHLGPDQVARWKRLYRDNTGISNAQILAFARDVGLKVVPPMSPTNEAILKWLRDRRGTAAALVYERTGGGPVAAMNVSIHVTRTAFTDDLDGIRSRSRRQHEQPTHKIKRVQ